MRRIKNIWKQYWISLLTCILLVFSFSKITKASQDFEILDSSDRGITIQFSPKVERIDTIQLSGESYYKIHFANTSFTGNPGDPMIPVKVINVGIPLESEANVSILSVESREIKGKLLPAPEIDRSDNYNFDIRSTTYQSPELFPQQIVAIGRPGFIRDQQVISINLFAMQYAGKYDRIKIYNKIVVRIDFVGKSDNSIEVKKSNHDDEFYRGVVINYPQSKKWLKKHTRKLKRVTSSFQNNPWYKISIRQEGMYKITGSDLSNIGIDINSINSKSIKIYNNGGRELPGSLMTPRPDSLIENAIRIVDLNNNGKLESADYILFYGKAVNNWEPLDGSSNFYQHYINHYTHENIYWLTWDNRATGKRMENKVSLSLPNTNPVPYFWGLYFDEDEINNFLNSGFHWFGRLMAGNSEYGYSVYLPNPGNHDNNLYFRFRCYGSTSGRHLFTFYINDGTLSTFEFYGEGLETHEVQNTVSLSPDGSNRLKIKYNGASSESQVYIDWFEVQYKKQFIAEDNYLIFNQLADGHQKYRITNFKNDQIDIYDITDWSNVQLVTNTEISSGTVTFGDMNTGFPRRKYVALTSEAYLQPEKIESIIFADIRHSISGADFIIISHDDFYDAILPLKQHREIYDSLRTEVVKISDIYHEFSWGIVDPIAIRDFVKFAFENWIPAPKYVLLCGDGDYDYKNIKNNLDKNWIPPYETSELNENSNRTMDEFFVTVSGIDDKPDLAVGRFPVQTAEQVQNVVEKIINYETSPVWNPDQTFVVEDWRNIVTIVGDDDYHNPDYRDETMHTNDAETIIENYVPNSYNKEKIYLIEYPAIREPSTSGFRKPAATEALIKRINNGTLILNYIGHGGPDIWADERLLLESRDFDWIQNQDKLPLWVAATCDFGRFDDPMEQGLAEKLFAAEKRGGIAFVTSARLAYASDNTALNREFYSQLFTNQQGTTERLGVALIRAKINNYSRTNDQKYHLFGDPTMRLAAPNYNAKITSIQPDTLKALSEIKVAAQIMKQNFPLDNLDAKAMLKVFDSKIDKIYTTPNGYQIRYKSQGKAIFRGALSVKGERFKASFVVPKDITYGGRNGRVSIYFANEQIHGSGYQDLIPVGGTSVLQDMEGPIIKIGFQGQDFIEGNLVEEKSILEVEIADSISGVNIAGDIGHNITMVVDEQESNEIILTELFNYYENNFKAGKVIYDFSNYKRPNLDQSNQQMEQYGLAPGKHHITIKAWDNFNNSSLTTASFKVVSDDVLKITNVFNYPNPLSSFTTFTFDINRDCKVKIKLYTVGGRLIESIDNLQAEAGMYHVDWDGRDRDGDKLANGVYLYKIIATTQQQGKNLKNEYIGKLVIAR